MRAAPLDLTGMDDAFLARFWSKVDQRGPDECWPWLRYCKPSGYGQFTLRKDVFIDASRVALALAKGPIGDGMFACHTCDNPPCCNPAHLFAGTGSDNAYDSVRKGRANRSRGEAHRSHKLTEAQVRVIRATLPVNGAISAIAREYGVSLGSVQRIRAGTSWRWLV